MREEVATKNRLATVRGEGGEMEGEGARQALPGTMEEEKGDAALGLHGGESFVGVSARLDRALKTRTRKKAKKKRVKERKVKGGKGAMDIENVGGKAMDKEDTKKIDKKNERARKT